MDRFDVRAPMDLTADRPWNEPRIAPPERPKKKLAHLLEDGSSDSKPEKKTRRQAH